MASSDEQQRTERTPLMTSSGSGATAAYARESTNAAKPAPRTGELHPPVIFDSEQPVGDELFDAIVEEVRYAIAHGVAPTRIAQGSSGSYFCRDRFGKIVGVFKPKNEEPYGQLNPKWTKWFQRTCMPCCFGRSCLIPNLGYISEAAAYTVDKTLGLGLVPHTQVVSLSSSSFYYSRMQRMQAGSEGKLPEKMGSFQVFVSGYKDAHLILQKMISEPMPNETLSQFRLAFERLVILDYIIRNTDRGNDNWLIKLDEAPPTTQTTLVDSSSVASAASSAASPPSAPRDSMTTAHTADDGAYEVVGAPRIRIAAIDHGLAFPWKHPDNWRAYPFGWAMIGAAKVPFSDETVELFLPRLQNPDFVDHLVHEIRRICELDADFNERRFRQQMSVLRGQVYNLVEALIKRKSPWELVQLPPVTIMHEDMSPGVIRRLMAFRERAPLFSKW